MHLHPRLLRLLLVCAFGFSATLLCASPAAATRGVLDLRRLDIDETGPIALHGEWLIRWNELLPPDAPREAYHDTIQVPSAWYSLEDSPTPERGIGNATYRLTLLLPDKPHAYGIRLRSIASAARLFLNGRELYRAGDPDADPEQNRARYRPGTCFFTASGPTELVIHVTNYLEPGGGLWTQYQFGTQTQVRNLRDGGIFVDAFIIGSILMIGFYHIGFFLFRRKERSAVFFGLFALCMALRTSMLREHLFSQLLGQLPFQWYLNISFTWAFLLLPLFCLFVRELFPRRIKPWITLLGVGAGFIYLGAEYLLPQQVSYRILPGFEIIVMLILLYFIVTAALAARDRVPGARYFLWGFIILSLTVLNDFLLSNFLYYSTYIAPLGMLVFLFLESLVLNYRFARAFDIAEELGDELEQRVESRTKELQEAVIRADSANRAKSEFLRNISHELRTPINGILGFAELIEEQASRGVIGDFAGKIGRESEQLLDLINQLLDISRIEADRFNLAARRFDLRALLDEVLESLRIQALAKGIEIRGEWDETIPADLIGDPLRLRQILINIGGNAVKFTASGSVALGAQLLEQNQKGVEIRFTVEDTGLGIPEEIQAQLFELFVQGSAGTDRPHSGTGLGTTISKQLTEIMGGSISFTSRPGEGTTFLIEVPFGTEDNERRPQPQKPAGTNAPRIRRTGTVMIVEDYAVNRDIIRHHLESIGLKTLCAGDGRAAIELYQEQGCDGIIMDVQMPGMDGYAATQALRALPHGETIPIIGLTAAAYPADLQRCLEVGMNSALTKPIRKRKLIREVEEMLAAAPPVRLHHFAQEWGDLAGQGAEVLDQFIAESRRALELATASRDWDERHRLLHALKGGALNVAAGFVALAAELAEKSAKERNEEKFLAALSRTGKELERLAEFHQLQPQEQG